MAVELSALTIFSPKLPSHRRLPTELRFSRWNNANAQPFIRKQRALQEIEDEIRRERRFDSASKIAENHENATTTTTTNENENFKSIGTPSSPSRPSIPGKSSKYSKPPKRNPKSSPNPNSSTLSHPAFNRIAKAPKVWISRVPAETESGISIGEDGVSYRIPNAPFEFQYSYTETPKVKPLALREPPFVPFGPRTMARPWTGKAPLTKKKLPEFDSFKLPPPHKKGVKPVQSPGPYLAGMGPRYVKSREEIMGEPLTDEEIKDLIQGCLRSQRQLNMGRDGLTHNMLDNIHAHWKRRRVCKIKCKGVCTVDMDNVRQQLEEKTGGKIIYNRGGVLFLYRGRNYNYRTRPRYPLMLWKPVTPVYPRLIKQPPEGLTMEEAKDMRKRGRELPPICKLGKNGVYSDLVKHVREAFEECELVRINCQGMNGSDYRKIGAKLKDLVPCVLVSFELEHILMWRGRDWKSSFPKSKDDSMEVKVSKTDSLVVSSPNYSNALGEQQEKEDEQEDKEDLFARKTTKEDASIEMSSLQNLEIPKATFSSLDSEAVGLEETGESVHSASEVQTSVGSSAMDTYETCSISQSTQGKDHHLVTMSEVPPVEKLTTLESLQSPLDESEFTSAAPKRLLGLVPASEGTSTSTEGSQCLLQRVKSSSVCMEGVILLRKQAIESGSAVVLDDASLDDRVVFDRAVALAKVAPPGPVFKHGPKKVLVQNVVEQQSGNLEVRGIAEKRIEKKSSRNQKSSRIQRLRDFKEVCPDTLPHGSLAVDELAKLLA